MKRGHAPLWFLRDLPALVGFAWSFWPLMIMVISSGRCAMSGKKISPRAFDFIMEMLPIAEAHLHDALCRQAWRALGWNVREAQLEILPPITHWSQVAARFEVYRADMMDLRAASARFTEDLREIYRIRTSVDANATRAAHASTDAALRAAAQHELVGVAPYQVALMLSSTRNSRPSKHERGLANARGPPTIPDCPLPTLHLPRKRELSGPRPRANHGTLVRCRPLAPLSSNFSPAAGWRMSACPAGSTAPSPTISTR